MYLCNIHSLEFVDRGSETQIQVGENLIFLVERFSPISALTVRFWRLKTVPALKELKKCSGRRPIDRPIQTKRKELTINLWGFQIEKRPMVYANIFQHKHILYLWQVYHSQFIHVSSCDDILSFILLVIWYEMRGPNDKSNAACLTLSTHPTTLHHCSPKHISL